jgi:sugar-specific transcriptional regulator TrmB
MLEREQKNLEVKKEELLRALPELTTLFNLSDQKPQVRYFEGKAGLEKMRDEFLKTKEKVLYGISSISQVHSVFPLNNPANIKSYSDRRVEKGIHVKAIYSHKGDAVYTKEDNAARLREVRYIDSDKMKFDADITLFDDSIAIAFLGSSLFGVIITQKDIAISFKNLFNFIWGIAEEK